MTTLRLSYALVLVLTVRILTAHPADTNKDGRIDLNELTLYGQAYSDKGSWPEGPSPIDAAHYERAVFIWQSGERYRTVDSVANPFGWIPDPVDEPPFVALSTGSAEPFDLVSVHDLNVEGELTARYRLDDVPGYFETLLDDSDGGMSVSIPLNPFTLTGEGTVFIELVHPKSGDVWRCPPLRLLPLPQASGASAQLINSIGSSLEQMALLSGYDLEDYTDTTDLAAVPQSIRPLLYMKSLVNHPDNPNSFERMIDTMAEEELANWDGIVAKLDLANRIAAPVGSTSSSYRTLSDSTEAETRDGCDGNEFRRIPNVLTLSQLMIAQHEADTELDDKTSSQDIADLLLNMNGSYEFGKTVGGKLHGIAVPASAAAPVISAIGTTLMIAKFFDYFDAGTLPSVFVSLDLTVDGPGRGYFIEDDAADNCGEATLMVRATVRSRGYDHEEMLANVAPGGPLPGLPGWNTVFQWVYDRYPNLDLLDLPPRTWCDIPGLGNDEYANITGDDRLKVTGYNAQKVGMDFIPLEEGPGLLTVEIKREKFGDAGFTETTDYETRPIEVEILNPQLLVTGDEESIVYRAQLKDAAQLGPNDLDWTVTAGQILRQTPLGEGLYELEWKPTDDQDDYPVTITARSKTEVCLRGKPDAQPRETRIEVNLEGWEIFPVVSCLGKGNQEIFLIDDGTENPPEVIWEVVSGNGTIEADSGLFTAGSFPGDVVIQATRVDNQETRTQTFRVGCELAGEIVLQSSDAPGASGTVKSLSTNLTIGFEGLVSGDVFLTYATIEPPAEGEVYGHVSGTYQGAGLYYPSNYSELQALRDTTDAIRSYPNGSGDTYDVSAGYFYEDITDDEETILLPDGPDGDLMEIKLDASYLSVAGYVEGLSNEIVSWHWTFSDGTTDVGSIITKTFSRSRRDLVIELEVRDKLGNWARIKEKILVVQINGTYRFAYDPSHTELACIYWTWPGEAPDDVVDPGVTLITTKDPDACGSTVIITGGRAATITAESTQVGVPVSDPQKYIISFLYF